MGRKHLSKQQRRALDRLDGRAAQGPPAISADELVSEFSLQALAWRGPLPPPGLLEQYGFIQEAPERLLAMAERQAHHRMKLEDRESWAEAFQRVWGAVSATAIALAGVGVGGWLLYTGHAVTGLAALLLPLSTLAAVAGGRRRERTREMEARLRGEGDAQTELPLESD